MKTKKLLMALLILTVMVFLPTTAQAASTDPYCLIYYDSALGCNTVKYYGYVGKVARIDSTRMVKFYDGKILLGTSNTLVTSSHKKGTNPGWSADGSFLIWQDSNNALWCRSYTTHANVKIADNVSALNFNAACMVATVSLKDGSSKNLADLLPKTSATPSPTPTPAVTNVPTPTPSVTATVTTPQKTTVTVKTNTVKQWTDAAGRDHFKFDGNEVIVDGKAVYLNSYKISDLCNSGVRFLGVDLSNRVYLYEDDSNSFYRFNLKNIFKPCKLKFASNCKLTGVNRDSNGFLKEVVTSQGTFKLSQLVVDKTWYPKQTYAINKSGYCVLYKAQSSKTYVLTLKGSKLYLGKKLITSGITRKEDSFGFQKNSICYIKHGDRYTVRLSNPKRLLAFKRGVKKLKYSSKNGLVKN